MKKKNTISKKQMLIIIIFIIIISLICWQYFEYKRGVKISTLSITEVDSSLFSLEVESLRTKYIPLWIKQDYPRDANNLRITTNRDLNFELILTSPKDFETNILRKIPGYDERKNQIEDLIKDLPTDPYILLHYLDNGNLPENSTILITLDYKKWNLFTKLFEPSKFTFAIETSDYEGSLGDMYMRTYQKVGAGPSDEELIQIEKRDRACPFWVLDEPVTEVYKVVSYNCPFFETGADLGEDVTVEIYTSDFEQGKQTFRDWLAENGLQESDRLRLEYVHVPK